MAMPSLERTPAHKYIYSKLHDALFKMTGPETSAGAAEPKRAYVFGFVQPTSPDFSKYAPKDSIVSYGGKLIQREVLADAIYTENTKGFYDAAFVVQFPSLQKALDWYNSEEYKEPKQIRLATSKGPLVIAEGNDLDKNTKGLVMGFFKVTNSQLFGTYAPQASMETYKFKPLVKVSSEKAPCVEEGNDFDVAGLFGFPTANDALKWMNSEEYKQAKAVRLDSTTGPIAILGDR